MFLTYLRRELRRRRRQTVVVAIGLAIGIGLVITVTAAASGVKAAQSTVLHSLYGVGTDISVTQAPQRGTGGPNNFGFRPPSDGSAQTFSRDRLMPAGGIAGLDDASVAKVGKLTGVGAAAGGLHLTDLKFNGQIPQFTPGEGGRRRFEGGGGSDGQQSNFDITTFSVGGVDPNATNVGPLTSMSTTSGRMLSAADANAKVALVESGYAQQNNLKVGSTVTVAGTAFQVVGVVSAPTGESTENVYIPLSQAQSLSGLTGKVTTIYVKATDSTRINAVSGAISKALPNATVSTSSDLAGQVTGSLSNASSLANQLGKWLSIVVLIAAFGVATLLTLSAVARRVREFGTLKAIGWRSRRIVGQVMGESLVQGLIGGVLGIGLGFGGAALVSKLSPNLSGTVGPASTGGGRPGGGPGGGFGAARRAASTVSVHLSTPVATTTVLLAVGLAILGGLLAGCFGGWRASRLRPAAALRRVE
jgi:ABC-type lipoprotein release transport system permease subunit